MLPLPLPVVQCQNELWEGVRCDLPTGHSGPHRRAASPLSAALTWRSSAKPSVHLTQASAR